MRLVLVVSLFVCAAWGSPRLDPLVDTKLGLIRGLQASDGDYSMFLGIPYARVEEDNPFGPSQPHPEFEDVFEAFDDSAICPQREEFENTITGTLDCLNLNIFVPNKASSRNRLPVLVWIHGGAYQIGFGGRFLYGPKYLVRQDIILVTVNYRLGPYGFMCVDNPDVAGNQGLKDQLNALRWIKSNIDAFGGDVNKVTIFGESAGAASVDLHLLSEQEKLFDKVMMQSGAALGPWAVAEPDGEAPLKLARHLGMETDDLDTALTFLTDVEPHLVIAATLELSLTFVPCVEKEFEGVETFIKDYPVNSAIPKAKNVAILTGYNNHENLLTYLNTAPEKFTQLGDVFKNNLETAFDFNENEDMADVVRQYYIGDEDMSEELKWALIDFGSDFYFNHPAHRSLQKYLENDARAVYHYVFSYNGGRNFVKRRQNVTEGGASHADELGYLFDMELFKETPSEEDQLVIDRMTTLWTNFVKYGNPTPETSELLPVQWEPVTSGVVKYLDIDSDLQLQRRPFHDRMAFWDLFYKTNIKLLKGYRNEE